MQDELYGKKINVIVDDDESPQIGIDLDDSLVYEVLQAHGVNQTQINQFTASSQRRDQLYDLIDSMCEDSKVSSALEIYVQCATERNTSGKIMWSTSDVPEVQKFVNYLMEELNIDKYVYKWMYCLAKYGDAYIQIFRESEVDDIFKKENKQSQQRDLNEDLKIRVFGKNDRYAHYVELHDNPSEIFELVRHGKTFGYIQTPPNPKYTSSADNVFAPAQYKYTFNKQDVTLMCADEYVHACLDSVGNRQTETVQITDTDKSYEYKIRRGKSILYNAFRSWKVLSLLENSMTLNRITKSSVIRIIGVKVGDMPKEDVKKHLYTYKNMIEQKSALNIGDSMNEYNSPGPMENFIVTAVRDNDQGNIVTSEIGGDVDVKGIADIDYFKNIFYGSLGIPKQYMGDTDDAAGFDAGKSLSLISSIFAKLVKRLQQAMIEAVTDIINLQLIDKGLDSYVNKFKIHMQEPTTQEELDKRDAVDKQLNNIRTVMDLLSDMDNQPTRLKIAGILLSDVLDNSDISDLISKEVEAQEELLKQQQEQEEGLSGGAGDEFGGMSPVGGEDIEPENFGSLNDTVAGAPGGNEPESGQTEPSGGGSSSSLPDIPVDMDLTDNTQF